MNHTQHYMAQERKCLQICGKKPNEKCDFFLYFVHFKRKRNKKTKRKTWSSFCYTFQVEKKNPKRIKVRLYFLCLKMIVMNFEYLQGIEVGNERMQIGTSSDRTEPLLLEMEACRDSITFPAFPVKEPIKNYREWRNVYEETHYCSDAVKLQKLEDFLIDLIDLIDLKLNSEWLLLFTPLFDWLLWKRYCCFGRSLLCSSSYN